MFSELHDVTITWLVHEYLNIQWSLQSYISTTLGIMSFKQSMSMRTSFAYDPAWLLSNLINHHISHMVFHPREKGQENKTRPNANGKMLSQYE